MKQQFIRAEIDNQLDFLEEIPPFYLKQMASRLSILSILTIALCLFDILILSAIYRSYNISPKLLLFHRKISILCIIVSTFVYFCVYSKKISFQTLMNIGAGYEIIGGFFIAFSDFLIPFSSNYIPRLTPTWLCIWIIMFPLIIPFPPIKSFFIAIVVASMSPIALQISSFLGNPQPPQAIIKKIFIVNYSSAILSIITSITIHKLNYEILQERKMGSYKLLEKLNEGGMGEIWKAEQTTISRSVAIKIILPEMLRFEERYKYEEMLVLFKKEAKAISSLHSPHSIKLYDFGSSNTGRFFYSMELLKGMDLRDIIIKYGTMPYNRVIYLLLQICDSLADAHHNKLVHSDIKPQNIFLCNYSYKYDFIKVLDFGLVKKLDKSKKIYSQNQQVKGTPIFMAPEMFHCKKFDEKIDIYALGLVGYWLLIGKHLSTEDNIKKILQKKDKNIPGEFIDIIIECIATDAKKRPQSTLAIYERLSSINIANPWTQKKAKNWWETHGE